MKTRFALMVLLALLVSIVVCAQDRTGVPVTVTVSVKAGHGNDVPGISQENLKLYENRKLVEISTLVPLQRKQNAVEVCFLIDESFNFDIGGPLSELPSFISSLPSTIWVAVGYMSHGHTQIAQEPTLDHNVAARAVRAPRGGSTGTDPYSAIIQLVRAWPENSMSREIFLITTGLDPTSYGQESSSEDETISAAQRAGVAISVIDLSRGMRRTELQELAKRTGGEIYGGGMMLPMTFAPYFEGFAERLNHQYRLTFIVQPGSKGAFQSIKLETSAANAKLLVADRVYVPAVK